MQSMDIETIRAQTPGCLNMVHFNNAGASLMPNSVLNAINRHLRLETEIGGYEAAELKRKEVKKFYQHAATLLHCSNRNIAFCSNATDAFSRALLSIPFEQGDIILTTENDYISNQIAFLSLKKRFKIEIIRAPDIVQGGMDIEVMANLIREKKPKLVSVTHVPTNSGLIQDVTTIGKICNEEGIIYLVDACQSAGQLALDTQSIQCDFLSATGRKYLRGPRGSGLLYVSDRILTLGLEPLMIDMRGAQWLEKDHYQPVDDAHRFEDWENSYALLLGLSEAIEVANQIGIPAIQQRVINLGKTLRSGLASLPEIRLLDHGEHLCGIVTFTLGNIRPVKLQRELRKRKINSSLSFRNYALIDFTTKNVDWALRLSLHYFNTYQEIEYCVDQVASIIQES